MWEKPPQNLAMIQVGILTVALGGGRSNQYQEEGEEELGAEADREEGRVGNQDIMVSHVNSTAKQTPL